MSVSHDRLLQHCPLEPGKWRSASDFSESDMPVLSTHNSSTSRYRVIILLSNLSESTLEVWIHFTSLHFVRSIRSWTGWLASRSPIVGVVANTLVCSTSTNGNKSSWVLYTQISNNPTESRYTRTIMRIRSVTQQRATHIAATCEKVQ